MEKNYRANLQKNTIFLNGNFINLDFIKFPELNKKPRFIRNSLNFNEEFQNVRKQSFFQKYFACKLLKTKANEFFKHEKYEEAAIEYEKVIFLFYF